MLGFPGFEKLFLLGFIFSDIQKFLRKSREQLIDTFFGYTHSLSLFLSLSKIFISTRQGSLFFDWRFEQNMCSNTSSSSGGGGGCGCNGGNGNGGVWSSPGLKIKQQKRPKIPKRGPGVAELEKIIREQNGEGISSPCFSSYQNQTNPCNPLSLKPHPPPPPPPSMTMASRGMAVPASHSSSLPSHVPLAPKFDHLSPATPPNMAALYGNGGYGTALRRSNSGSGLVLPEQPYFPMNLSSCRSNIDGLDGSQSDSGNSSSRNLSTESNPLWSYPPLIPKRHNTQCPPPMMNQFLGSGTPAPPSPTSLPSGLHNHVEPPSNQSSYYNYTVRAPEEQKIVGMKRPHPLSMSLDNSLVPPSHFQYSPNFPPYNRPHQSSPNDNHSSNSFASPNESHRDAKWGSTLELNGKRFNYDNGGSSHANFPTFGAPSPPMHIFQGELSMCNVLPYRVPESRMEDSYQRSESSGSDHKPFYSFLEVKEQLGKKDAGLGSNHEDCEAGTDGIDLSLKL